MKREKVDRPLVRIFIPIHQLQDHSPIPRPGVTYLLFLDEIYAVVVLLLSPKMLK